MSAAPIHTRRLTGLDYRVWLVMLLTWVLCGAWLGYRQVQSSRLSGQPCRQATIFVNSREDAIALAEMDRIVTFRIGADPGAKVEWTFGDGKRKAYGQVVTHRFDKEGNFSVKATVNGRCTFKKEVLVKRPIVIGQEARVLRIFSDSDKTMVGSSIRFSGVCNLPVADYEWTLLETGEVKRGEVVTFTFSSEGPYSVQLVANRDYLGKVIKPIKVEGIALPNILPDDGGGGGGGEDFEPQFPPIAAGPEPSRPPGSGSGSGTPAQPVPTGQDGQVPTSPAATNVNPETFKAMLQSVLDGDKELDELYPFLAYRETTKVLVNGKEPLESLRQFCRERRKRKIETLEFQIDEQKSIRTIKVKMKRRLPFGIGGG